MIRLLFVCLLVTGAPLASALDLAVPEGGFVVTVPKAVQLLERADFAAKEPPGGMPANFCFPRFHFGGVAFTSMVAKLGDHESVEQWTQHHLQRQELNPDTMDYRHASVELFKSRAGIEGFLFAHDSKPKSSACWTRHRGVVFTNRRSQVICLSAYRRAEACGGPTDLETAVFASLRLE